MIDINMPNSNFTAHLTLKEGLYIISTLSLFKGVINNLLFFISILAFLTEKSDLLFKEIICLRTLKSLIVRVLPPPRLAIACYN